MMMKEMNCVRNVGLLWKDMVVQVILISGIFQLNQNALGWNARNVNL
jgi:hypothetical protein